MKTKENAENINKILNAWLRNSRSILTFMKKEIKDTKRETGRKVPWEQLSSFNNIFINNKEPSHTLKDRAFFLASFAKRFIIQITWNTILSHRHGPPAINYGKHLVEFFFKIFPAVTPFSFFFLFAPDDSLRENSETLTAPLHLMNPF